MYCIIREKKPKLSIINLILCQEVNHRSNLLVAIRDGAISETEKTYMNVVFVDFEKA